MSPRNSNRTLRRIDGHSSPRLASRSDVTERNSHHGSACNQLRRGRFLCHRLSRRRHRM